MAVGISNFMIGQAMDLMISIGNTGEFVPVIKLSTKIIG